jgi:hypothetical protein
MMNLKTICLAVLWVCNLNVSGQVIEGKINWVGGHSARKIQLDARKITTHLDPMIQGIDINPNENFYFSLENGAFYLTLKHGSFNDSSFTINVLNDTLHLIINYPPKDCPYSKNVKACPFTNHHQNILPVFYGVYSRRVERAAHRGKIILGGSSEVPCTPKWFCSLHRLYF